MEKMELKEQIKSICEYALIEGKNTDWDDVCDRFVNINKHLSRQISINRVLEYFNGLIIMDAIKGQTNKSLIEKLKCITKIYNIVEEWD